MKNIRKHAILQHETKRHVLFKFLTVFLIFLTYFVFMTLKYGVSQGIFVSVLTWSFFVLCTPIADAGFLVDFPVRLVTKMRMIHSEIIVWTIAISLNVYTFFFNPGLYEKTKILTLFKHILESPLPFWLIIFVSFIGTFLSISFGDELFDKVKHKERVLYEKHRRKHKFLAMAFLILISILLYDYLLTKLGVDIPI